MLSCVALLCSGCIAWLLPGSRYFSVTFFCPIGMSIKFAIRFGHLRFVVRKFRRALWFRWSIMKTYVAPPTRRKLPAKSHLCCMPSACSEDCDTYQLSTRYDNYSQPITMKSSERSLSFFSYARNVFWTPLGPSFLPITPNTPQTAASCRRHIQVDQSISHVYNTALCPSCHVLQTGLALYIALSYSLVVVQCIC